MSERATRFDEIVAAEEKKKKENLFEKANRTVKNTTPNPQPNVTESQDEKDGGVVVEDTKEETKTPKKSSKETKSAQDKASDVVSKRLNISDITDATQRVKKKGGRSRTFYMQDAMYDKLASVAEKQGIKPSQLLHAILDNVLDKM